MTSRSLLLTLGLCLSCATLSNTASAQVATLSASAISFGNVVVGSTATRNLSITNTGAGNLVISGIVPAGSFGFSNCGSANLAPNAKCTVSVTFTPSSTGSSSGSLTITDNASNSPQTVTLSGTGVAAVSFSPPSLTFSNQAIGTSSVAKNISVINNQTVTLNISSITTTGNFTASTCPSTLGAQSSCVVSVTFTPSASGILTGSLVVNDNAGTTQQTASLTGTGVQPVTFSQTGITFGNQVVGTTSSAKTLTLTNNQSIPLNISSITTTADFSAGSCATPIAAYGTCAISVTFTPPTTGSISGTLTVNDDASTTPQTAALSGMGIASVSLSPTILQFSGQLVGTTSAAKTVVLSNNQGSVLSVSSVSATGAFSASTCPASIASGTTCVINVTFTPTVTGNSSGTMTVIDSAANSPQTVTLEGTGTPVQLTSITVTPVNPSIAAGTNEQFTATGNYNNGTNANLTSSVTWSSSTTSVATVSAAGLATGVSASSSTISATSGSLTGSTVLNVTPPALVSILVTPTNPSVTAGSSQQFTATGTYTNGGTSNLTASVVWTSSNLGAATISGTGLATALSPGSTTIGASQGPISGSTNLTVTPSVTSIAITPFNPTIAAGSIQQLTATATFSDGSTQNVTSSASWTTSVSAVATVSATGLATAVAQGATTISATFGSVTGQDTFNVGPAALVSISVTPNNPSLSLNTTQQFTATGTFTDGSTQNLTSTGVTWSAGGVAGGSSTVGTVSSSGLYAAPSTAPNPSLVAITATSNSTSTISGTSTISISQIVITVSPATAQAEVDQTQQFTATLTGNSNTSVTWSADGVAGGNSTVGTISASGLYNAPASPPTPPQVTITATSAADGVTNSSATITVVPIITVTISPTSEQYVSTNATEQFTATVSGSSNIAVTWSAGGVPGGNIIVGTVSNSGLYTAPPVIPNPQHIPVTATSVVDTTKSASTIATVTPPNGVSVILSPVTSWVEIGNTMQFLSTVFGTTNSTVTWSVNGIAGGNSTVGTITSTGLYTPPASVPNPAQVTVTATSVANNSKSASGFLTVGTTPFLATPLIDFSPGQLYQGQFSGMLYNGSNSAPPDQLAAGQAAASLVQPLDGNGNPNPNGKIGLISIGMSETFDDWCDGSPNCTSYSFMGQAAANGSVNHSSLVIVNGATSGATAAVWSCAEGYCPLETTDTNQYDRVRDTILTPAGLTEAQVQVVWIQEADPSPTWSPSLPNPSADAYNFEYELAQVIHALKMRWPNVQQVFVSSRIYAGYATTIQNPEPYAYEYGFAVKWLINAQMLQRQTGVVDPLAGDLITNVPWVDWGPYLWGSGTNNPPGSQAITWVPADYFSTDGLHPSNLGVTKVGDALMNFFLNSPVTPWFTN